MNLKDLNPGDKVKFSPTGLNYTTTSNLQFPYTDKSKLTFTISKLLEKEVELICNQQVCIRYVGPRYYGSSYNANFDNRHKLTRHKKYHTIALNPAYLKPVNSTDFGRWGNEFVI